MDPNNNPLKSMDDAISWYQMVELTVPATTTGPVAFGPQPQLQNQPNQRIWIKNIELFTVTTYKNSQQTPSIVGIAVADIPKGILTLSCNGVLRIKQIPLVKLIRANDQTNPFQPWITTFNTLENVEWEQSQVVFSSATAAAIQIMAFGVTYIKANVVKNSEGREVLKYV